VFQALNGNRRLDVTVRGVALEPSGTWNNPRPQHRAAAGDDVKFALPEDGARIVIGIR